MFETFTFWLVVLAVLTIFLAVSISVRAWHRYRDNEARELAFERRMASTSTAFDASIIAPQIERVRSQYLATPHLRTHPSRHRVGLLAAARQIVANLSYFRGKTTENARQ